MTVHAIPAEPPLCEDLRDAQAAVNWAIAQTEDFDKRIKAWAAVNIDIRIEDSPAPATHDRVIALQKEPLPRTFNVEIGAYINTIRSSLDILAVAVAKRHGITNLSEVYFPVARSVTSFTSGNYKGNSFVKRLPDVERRKIESLQPYQGGNHNLWDLHNLDIVRKHHRLIEINARPIGLTRDPTFANFIPHPIDQTLSINQETIVGFLSKGRQDNYMKFFPLVACSEPGVAKRVPVLAAILHFADTANKIISLFNIT